MNKIAHNLLGTAAAIAFVAGVSAVPASANGLFVSSGPAAFSFNNTSFQLTNAAVDFADFDNNAFSSGSLSLSGTGLESGSSFIFDNTQLTYSSPTAFGISETGKATVTFSGTGAGRTVEITDFSAFTGNGHTDDFQLGPYSAPTNGGPVNPVPEASTMVSFGALLALGGLAVLRRKSVKNAA